jgi:hypothetical protein
MYFQIRYEDGHDMSDFVGDNHCPFRRILHRVSSGNAEKNNDKLDWKQSCTSPRLDIGTSWVRNSSANHWIAKFWDTRHLLKAASVLVRCLKIIFSRHFYSQKNLSFTLLSSMTPPFSRLCGKGVNKFLSFGFKNVTWNPTFPSICSVQSTNTF